MSDFDQALYDAVMEQCPHPTNIPEGRFGRMIYAEAAQNAARIAAERQATVPPSDEAVELPELPVWVSYLEIHRGSVPEYAESFGKWHCIIRGEKDPTGSFRLVGSKEYQETPAAALQCAPDQICCAE